MTEGILDIRGPAEPAAMASPTTITGTNDGGQITAGTLSTPTVRFVQKVTSPAVTDVTIDAAFSLVAPNSLRGSIDEDRNVRLTASLRVDLTLRVQILPGKVYRCAASPVALVLEGHHDGTAVRLRAPNFSVPAVPTTADCESLISDGINEQLAGGGHSLTLDMTGELTAPLAPGEDSTTALTVAPAGTVAAGEPVTLTATVAPGAAAVNDDVPTGVVEFRDGTVGIGQVELDGSGQAQLVTSSLQGGTRVLTAHYLGSAPIYAPSSSTATSLSVTTPPAVTVDMPSAVVTGSSIDFDVVVRNSDYSAALTGGRLDIAIHRIGVGRTGAIGPVGETPRISVARLDGDDVAPVPLIYSGTGFDQLLQGPIDPPAGQPLTSGETRRVRLRLAVASNTPLGPIRVTVALTDTLTDTIVAEGAAETDMIATERHVTTLTAGAPFGIGGPPPPVMPVRARAGQTVEIYALKLSANAGSSVRVLGSYTFSIDGKPLLVRQESGGGDDQWVEAAAVSGTITPVLLLPADVGVGPRLIAVSYSGDRNHAPATATFPVTIDPPIGPSYECVHTGTFFQVARAQLEGRATLPNAGAPPTVVLDNPSLKLRLSRNTRAISMVQYLPTLNPGITVELAGGGTLSAEGITLANATEMRTDDPAAVDMVATITGITGTADITGPAGAAVDVAIASITIDYLAELGPEGTTETIRCTPAGEMFSFGEVTVAGVDIDAPEVAAAGSEVTLSAQGHPAGPGSIEFTADGRTVGHVATADGAGTIWTRDLTTGGDVDVIATFYPAGLFPAVSSEPHRIRVITTCAPLDEGTGATVRLVYIQLLGRCPDAAGYAYWTGQLDGGLDRAVFAQRISASLEARKVIVADAYRLLLDRAPDAAGATFWAERLGRNARYDDLLAAIAASPEFRSRAGGTDTGVVGRLYERIIGRSPDSTGRDYWVGVLRTRGITQVVRSFVNLPEPLAAIVTSSYEDVLDRAPTVEERTAAVDALRASGDRSALYASIIATDDFATRAQTFPELV